MLLENGNALGSCDCQDFVGCKVLGFRVLGVRFKMRILLFRVQGLGGTLRARIMMMMITTMTQIEMTTCLGCKLRAAHTLKLKRAKP